MLKAGEKQGTAENQQEAGTQTSCFADTMQVPVPGQEVTNTSVSPRVTSAFQREHTRGPAPFPGHQGRADTRPRQGSRVVGEERCWDTPRPFPPSHPSLRPVLSWSSRGRFAGCSGVMPSLRFPGEPRVGDTRGDPKTDPCSLPTLLQPDPSASFLLLLLLSCG